MLRKHIKYVDTTFDADNNPIQTPAEGDFYFSLTKAEALEINLIEDLESVGKSSSPKAIIPVFKNVVFYSYGVKTPEGRFSKDLARTEGFLASDAYSELFLELLKNGEDGVNDFIKGVLGFDPNQLKADSEKTEGTSIPAHVTQPSDYKPSAREIAAQAKGVPADAVDVNTTLTPQRFPEIDEERWADYQRFLAREEEAGRAVRVDPGTHAVDVGDTPGQIEVTSPGTSIYDQLQQQSQPNQG